MRCSSIILDHRSTIGSKVVMEPLDAYYKKIEDTIWNMEVHQSRQQCQDKWE
jgi:hypothetical protein